MEYCVESRIFCIVYVLNSQRGNTRYIIYILEYTAIHYATKDSLPPFPLFYLLPAAEFLVVFEAAVGWPKRVSPLDLLVKSRRGWSVGATPQSSRWSGW